MMTPKQPKFLIDQTKKKRVTKKQEKGSHTMTVGKQGISKSFSYLFAWYLTSITTRYRYDNHEEAKQLIRLGFLQQKLRKITYFSFNDNILNYTYCIDLLLAQCPELQKEILNHLQIEKISGDENIFEETIKKIISLYTYFIKHKNIRLLVIFDQINFLALICKLHNSLAPSQTKYNLQKQIIFLKQVLKQLRSLGYSIYNSPENIELYLLGSPQPGQYTLQLNYRSPVNIVNCKYQIQIFLNQICLKQLYRIIWYQLSKSLGDLQLIAKYNKQVLEHCDKLALKNGFISTLTPYSLRQSLNTKSISQNISIQQLKAKIENITSQVIQNGFNLLKEKSQNYFKDDNSESLKNKLKISLLCLSQFQMQKQKLENKIQQQKTKESNILLEISWQKLSKCDMSWKQISTYVNKDIFAPIYVDKNNKYLKLIISNAQFQRLNWLKYFVNPKLFNLFNIYIQKHPQNGIIGLLLQKYLIQYMQINKNCTFKNQQQSFGIKDVSNFLHFNYSRKNVSLNLQNICKKAKQQYGTQIFGIPVTQRNQKSTISKCICFILVKYNMKTQYYSIISYDFTLQSSPSAITTKLTQGKQMIAQIFMELMLSSNNSNIIKINQWEHRVVCRKQCKDGLKHVQDRLKQIYLKENEKDSENEDSKAIKDRQRRNYQHNMIKKLSQDGKILLKTTDIQQIKFETNSQQTQSQYSNGLKKHFGELLSYCKPIVKK